jgi:hypothetical protein
MNKLVVATLILSALAVNSVSPFFGRGCGGCRVRPVCNNVVECEEQPVCFKMVRKECNPRKVCETTCHWVCPPDTIREEANGPC